MGRRLTRLFIHAGRGKQYEYISTYAGAYRLNLLQETLHGTGSAENLPLVKNRNSYQCENCGVRLSRWAGQRKDYREWNDLPGSVEICRPTNPSIVSVQNMAVALERRA